MANLRYAPKYMSIRFGLGLISTKAFWMLSTFYENVILSKIIADIFF